MRTLSIRACLVAVLAGYSVPVAAQATQRPEPGWYVGGGIGGGDYALPSANVEFKSDGTRSISYQFFVGYRVNSVIAVEAGYSHFGDMTRLLGWSPGVIGACSINVVSPCNGNVTEDVSAEAYKVALAFSAPIRKRLGVFGRLGIAGIDITRVESQYVSQYAKERKNRPLVGGGARYALGPVLALRAEWEWFPGNVRAYFAGLEWQFRN